MNLHPTALVDSKTELSDDVTIGPYSIIKKGVKVGQGTVIHEHVVLEENTVIGNNNQIFPGVVLGGPPQDLSWKGEPSNVIIGDRNVIREYVTIHRATSGGATTVGNDNYLMAYMHAGHNVRIGNGCMIANAVQLAGYVEVEDNVVIGGLAGIHQFVRIGKMAMVGGLSRIAKDVPPFVKANGGQSKVFGLNIIALRRNGIPVDRREALKKAYALIYRSGMNLSQACAEIEKNLQITPEVLHLLRFLKAPSHQGILSREESGKNLPEDPIEKVTPLAFQKAR